jgi:hypothetical protein
MQQAVNHWIIVQKIGERKTTLILPDGAKEQYEAYCKILNAGPLAKIEEAGMKEGDLICGPRILYIPGLPPNVGMMSVGDVYYKIDELPEGVTSIDQPVTVDDVLNPKPVTDEVES